MVNLLELTNYSITFYIYCLFSEDFRNTLVRTLRWEWLETKLCRRKDEVKPAILKLKTMITVAKSWINIFIWFFFFFFLLYFTLLCFFSKLIQPPLGSLLMSFVFSSFFSIVCLTIINSAGLLVFILICKMLAPIDISQANFV